MPSGEKGTDSLPHGIAVLFALFMLGVSAHLFLTCFHPARKRQLHWGRFGRGPVLSRWSHVAAAIWAASVPWVIAKLSFDIPGGVEAVGQVVVVAASAAMIGGMIYDCAVHWLKPTSKPSR